jgi:hypothetical protein
MARKFRVGRTWEEANFGGHPECPGKTNNGKKRRKDSNGLEGYKTRFVS